VDAAESCGHFNTRKFANSRSARGRPSELGRKPAQCSAGTTSRGLPESHSASVKPWEELSCPFYRRLSLAGTPNRSRAGRTRGSDQASFPWEEFPPVVFEKTRQTTWDHSARYPKLQHPKGTGRSIPAALPIARSSARIGVVAFAKGAFANGTMSYRMSGARSEVQQVCAIRQCRTMELDAIYSVCGNRNGRLGSRHVAADSRKMKIGHPELHGTTIRRRRWGCFGARLLRF